MSKTHWKKLFNPNYLGAYSLEPGEEKILTVKAVKNEMVKGQDGREEECLVVYWKEDEKPMIQNKTNATAIALVAGSPYIEDWPGTKVQIHTQRVKAFGSTVEALRVRDFKPTEKRKLNDDEFLRLLAAIKKGQMSRQKAVKEYDLTDDQFSQLGTV